MKKTLKKIAFLTPKLQMTFADFDKYWKDVHGPIVANSPEYHIYRNKYVQNHILNHNIFGNSFEYSGIAEFWLPNSVPNEDIFSSTEIYQSRIQVDEKNFIDMDKTISMTASEIILMPGDDATKIMIASELSEAFGRDEIDEGGIESYFSSIMRSQRMCENLRGFTVDVVYADSFRLPGAKSVDPLRVACMETFRFRDVVSAKTSLMDLFQAIDFLGVRRSAGLGRCQSLLATEMVFFEDGAPGTLAATLT